jgi:hypothetical protein
MAPPQRQLEGIYLAPRSIVRFEAFETMHDAISREKQLKRWHRQWKINLIESENPQWIDLSIGLGLPPISPNAPSATRMDPETSSG